MSYQRCIVSGTDKADTLTASATGATCGWGGADHIYAPGIHGIIMGGSGADTIDYSKSTRGIITTFGSYGGNNAITHLKGQVYSQRET